MQTDQPSIEENLPEGEFRFGSRLYKCRPMGTTEFKAANLTIPANSNDLALPLEIATRTLVILDESNGMYRPLNRHEERTLEVPDLMEVAKYANSKLSRLTPEQILRKTADDFLKTYKTVGPTLERPLSMDTLEELEGLAEPLPKTDPLAVAKPSNDSGTLNGS